MNLNAPSAIFPLVSERKVASLLGKPLPVLRELSQSTDRLYRPFDQKKKSGTGIRQIDNPCDRLKATQAQIYRHLLSLVPLPSFMFGGVPGKSVRNNAEPHVGQRWVIAVDIEQYFPSITTAHVASIWRHVFGTGHKTTRLLTALTTYQGRLPQGAPTSTAIANMVLSPILETFRGHPMVSALNLSAWVDDICFSGVDAPGAIDILAKMLSRNGFRISRGKIRVMHAGERQDTTKVVVNRKPSIGSNRKRMIRDAVRSNLDSETSSREKGLLAHTHSICEAQGKSLRRLLARRANGLSTKAPR
jgi:hypothetical protein